MEVYEDSANVYASSAVDDSTHRTQAGARPFLCVYASQVAACIGANRHKKISEALEATWARVAPEAYYAAMERNGLKTADQAINEIMAKSQAVKTMLDRSLIPQETASSDHIASAYETQLQTVMNDADLLEDEKRAVDDVLRRNLYTTFGNVKEHVALDHVCALLGIEAVEDTTFYKQQGGTVRLNGDQVPWYIGGKIDAINPERSLVIEIKNRINRLFYNIPYHEQIQLQAYLELLQINHGVLCECYSPGGTPGGEAAATTAADAEQQRPAVQVNMAPMRRDPEAWARDVLPKLQTFVEFLAALLENTPEARKLQDKYLASKRKVAMITGYKA